jgi:hypothetical protein
MQEGKLLLSLSIIENSLIQNWIKCRVDSGKEKLVYSHRMSLVEPVFDNNGTNKGINRFSLSGKKKAQGQRQLLCIVHNIEKLANYAEIVA